MIATQTSIGSPGEQPTTELSWAFDSMINVGNNQIGFNSEGIHKLNSGTLDNVTPFISEFTLATSSLGINNPKRCRYLYLMLDVLEIEPVSVSIKLDKGAWRTYASVPHKDRLQRVRVPVGRNGTGAFVTIKVSSENAFRVSEIEGLFIARPLGLRGY